MDESLSAVIIALITGLFSTVSLLIKTRQEKVITKIDKQNEFIEKEKNLKQHLDQCEKERLMILKDIIMLILDTNLRLLEKHDGTDDVDVTLFERSKIYKEQLEENAKAMKEFGKEYEMLLNLSSLFQQELDKLKTS